MTSFSLHRTLLVEKNPTGHRLYYVRLLAMAAHERGDSVTIALNSAHKAAEEIMVHLNNLPPVIQIVFVRKFDVESVAQLSNDVNSTLTVVSDGDLFAIELGRRGRWSGRGVLSILVMREFAQPSRVPGLKVIKSAVRSFFFARAARLSRVRVSLLKPVGWIGKASFPIAPDPVTMTSSDQAVALLREAWGIGHDRYWFGILGAISARKNVDMVARALATLSSHRVGLLIGGQCDPSTVERMRTPIAALRATGIDVVIQDRLLSNAELDAAVSMVDCIVLAHSNEGSSGLFGKATAAGTRIVAAGARSLQGDCAAVPESSRWVPLRSTELARAMTTALGSPRPSPLAILGAADFTKVLL
jgi:hypothetical protein